jgi:hypothetical protein
MYDTPGSPRPARDVPKQDHSPELAPLIVTLDARAMMKITAASVIAVILGASGAWQTAILRCERYETRERRMRSK